MDQVLKGILSYNVQNKPKFRAEMHRMASEQKKAHVVLTCCMDCRVFPVQFIHANVGEMYYMRNAGNLIPHYDDYSNGSVSTEGGGLELACILGQIRDVIVCGHSDCKAMGVLHDMRHKCDHKLYHDTSPLKTWIAMGGHRTARIFNEIQEKQNGPMTFDLFMGKGQVKAEIDPDNRLSIVDKLSLLNVLVQVENINSYPFIAPHIKTGKVRVHALWFDVYTGNVYMFSVTKKRFVLVDEKSLNVLMQDAH